MYPLKDNTIYINRLYDIMYASKNCMYMVYQIIKSKYFTDYIDSKRQERPGLFSVTIPETRKIVHVRVRFYCTVL